MTVEKLIIQLLESSTAQNALKRQTNINSIYIDSLLGHKDGLVVLI